MQKYTAYINTRHYKNYLLKNVWLGNILDVKCAYYIHKELQRKQGPI